MPTTAEDLKQELASLYSLSQFAQAAEVAGRLWEIDKQDPSVLATQALSLYKAGNSTQAIPVMREYIDIIKEKNIDQCDAHYNFGLILLGAGLPNEAAVEFLEAYKLNPEHADTLQNLGLLQAQAGKMMEACQLLGKAVQLAPNSISALVNFGSVLKDAGDVTSALHFFSQALSISKAEPGSLSNICYALQFISESPSQLLAEHKRWADVHETVYKSDWTDWSVLTRRETINLGFIGQDFRRHTVGHYLLPVLKYIDKDRFNIKIVNFVPKNIQDATTNEFMELSNSWIDMDSSVDNSVLADTISKEDVDVLFDLSGHTAGTKLPMMAMYHPAPIQMHWLGYVGTTGTTCIDYVVTNFDMAPVGSEGYYTEKLLRLGPGLAHQCYVPPVDFPALDEEPPANKNGYITFGASANAAKLNKTVMSLWLTIIKGVPNSRLLLQFKGGDSENNMIVKAFKELAQSVDIDATRIITRGFVPYPSSIDVYRDIDIVLDPYPFSGCTTTCEALMMGCPVITHPGLTAASRHTYSFLNTMGGLWDCVATSFAGYISAAQNLALRDKRRVYLRKNLRKLFLESNICSPKLYADQLSSAIIKILSERVLGTNHD